MCPEMQALEPGRASPEKCDSDAPLRDCKDTRHP